MRMTAAKASIEAVSQLNSEWALGEHVCLIFKCRRVRSYMLTYVCTSVQTNMTTHGFASIDTAIGMQLVTFQRKKMLI